MEEEMEKAVREAGAPMAFQDFYNNDEGKELAAIATVASPADVADGCVFPYTFQ
jgi:hypothetical protein